MEKYISVPSYSNPQTVESYDMDYFGRVFRTYLTEKGVHHTAEEKAGGSAKFTGKYRWSSRPRRIPSIQCRRSKPGFWKLFGIRE